MWSIIDKLPIITGNNVKLNVVDIVIFLNIIILKKYITKGNMYVSDFLYLLLLLNLFKLTYA